MIEAEAALCRAIELDPADALLWHNLGFLLDHKLNRSNEAKAAYRRAIELDPADAWPWNNMGTLLADKLNRRDEAEAAWWQAQRDELHTRIATTAARRALESGTLPAMREALQRLLDESTDIAATLISVQFVEGFLVPLLAKSQDAKCVLDVMRELGYEKHARPLLLALEAAVLNRPEMLAELEPEVQLSTKIMFMRLSGKKRKKVSPSNEPS